MKNCALILLSLCSLKSLYNTEVIHDKKRLLLTDPDVLANRISHLETLVQNLQAGYKQQEGVIATLQQELNDEKAKTALIKNYGSTYIRWGRTGCDGVNTELVYKGYAAGEKYTYSSSQFGGAANLLCLPENPDLSNVTTADGYSNLYSSELEDTNFNSARQEDIPCAVCRSLNTTSSLMFPATKSCYPGWKEEYHGIVVSGAYIYAPSEFICLDSSPQFVPGGHANTNGNLLYITRMKCDSLLCPPFKENLQVLCVVCSK